MDAFYVSVELRRRPRLRGLPVILAGAGPRAVVTTASYEARRFGVGSRCPPPAPAGCVRRDLPGPDFAYYREASIEVISIVRRHIEQVEIVGLDEVYAELTGSAGPPRGRCRVRSQIERDDRLGCSIGIGPKQARREGRLRRREAARIRDPDP